MSELQKVFAWNVKNQRKIQNISQGTLAEMIGMDQGRLSKIESGKIEPGLATVEVIAKGLKVTVSELFIDASDVQSTISEKLMQIKSLPEYDQKLLEALLESLLEKTRLASLNDVKMKKRLEDLEKVRGQK